MLYSNTRERKRSKEHVEKEKGERELEHRVAHRGQRDSLETEIREREEREKREKICRDRKKIEEMRRDEKR